jgi:hypothetical protein
MPEGHLSNFIHQFTIKYNSQLNTIHNVLIYAPKGHLPNFIHQFTIKYNSQCYNLWVYARRAFIQLNKIHKF